MPNGKKYTHLRKSLTLCQIPGYWTKATHLQGGNGKVDWREGTQDLGENKIEISSLKANWKEQKDTKGNHKCLSKKCKN